MNLKQLEVFVAVAESGSFSRAAEATFITQSTASQHISALEEEFGLRLLDRTGKGVFPTEGGKILLERARQILSQAREVPLAIKRFRGLEEVLLKIGASNIPGNYLLPAALPPFLRSYPGIRLAVVQGDSRETLERLKDGEIEIGVIGTLFDEEGILFQPLGGDRIVLTVEKHHRWSKGQPITGKGLLQEKFVIREEGSGTEKTVREVLTKAGIEIGRMKIQASLGSNEAVKQAVANGIGAAFLSEMSIRNELRRGEVSTVKVRGLQIFRRFYLIRRRGRDLSPPAGAMADMLLRRYARKQ